MMKFFVPIFLILPLSAVDKPAPPGELAFQTNCTACHMLASVVVGPSMVSLAKTYPKEKREEFIAWAKEPGKKNTNMIQMPSMAHVPDADLGGIHDYILSATKGIKDKSGKALYQKFKEPKRPLPYVARASMPDSSPASVGVVLENGLSVCWDTEACRFRYAYVGDKTNLFSMWKPASLPNKPYYIETSEQLFLVEGKPQFLGYRLVEKDPEFRYSLGNYEISELVSAGAGKKSVTRKFTIANVSEPLVLDLSNEGKATLTSDKGTLKEGGLTLTADEAKSFTLTITKK
ncbi:MAG: cytochrome c551/c552 [Akkermansiaceae bacterium]|jgi:cytochrome c551/c552